MRSKKISTLYKYLKRKKVSRLIIFCGGKSYENAGIRLPDGIETKIVKNIKSNPQKKNIISCIAENEPPFDCILAVGGGSVIDFAKAYIYYTVKKPFIVVTTTAGSGSEATSFAAVYDGKEKESIKGDLLPDLVISDPDIVDTMPANIWAASWLDAFIHSIESQWSCGATWLSRLYSKLALFLLLHGRCIDGAYYAGKAINIAKTNIVHAVSYRIMLDYGMLHGFSVGVAYVLLFPDARYCDNIKQLLIASGIQIPNVDIKELIDSANKERLMNYDRKRFLQSFARRRV